MSKFYVTTAIAYTNAKPHIGFALELIQADALARYRRMMGDEVYFLTGTDEHGMKMAQAAREANVTPQELADKNSKTYEDLTKFLELTNDQFIRTSSEFHKRGAQKLWKALVKSGDIYKDAYTGLYCVGCEAYVTEKDLVKGNCPIHQKAPEFLSEENYFFRYSKYLPEIKKLIETDGLKIIPLARKTEMLNLIEKGIEEKRDVSFSRPVKALNWGVPIPDDLSQTMYVWCDALSNYITALDYEHEGGLFKKFWPADVHIIGKDILRFHAGFWPAILMSSGIELPKSIYVHGYVTSEGKKMSKTLGNVIDPFEICEKYGADALRYYLLREIPTTEDGDFSGARFNAVYEGELADNLGNLVSRVITMAEKYCGGKIPPFSKSEEISERVLETWKEYQAHFGQFDLKSACADVFSLLSFANRYIDEKKPWEIAKKEPARILQILYHLLELLRHAGMIISPIMPEAASKIKEALRFSGDKLYPDNITWGILKEGASVKKPKSLFPKLR